MIVPRHVACLYNGVMMFKQVIAPKQQVVHWLVLLSLLLGQFALGFGYGIAAEKGNDEIRIPVCTSTGIEYIIWTSDGVTQSPESGANPASGKCELCNVSPPQLRFNLQDGYLFGPAATVDLSIAHVAPLDGSTFVLNPNAAPRAPPSV